MTTKPHPTDAMEMPKDLAQPFPLWTDLEVQWLLQLLRSERIKAYDLGRQGALEEVEEELTLTYHAGAGPEGWLRYALDTIRRMKHEKQ